jgi:hypothetical protein
MLYDFAIERVEASGHALTLDRLEASLAEEWIECMQYFRARGEYARFRTFSLRTISVDSWGDFPTVEQQMKGAVSKQLFRFVADKGIANATAPAATRYAVIRGSMLLHLSQFVRICDNSPIIFPVAVAARAQGHGRDFLQLYQYLREWGLACDRPGYRVRPKLHYFAELVEAITVQRENPRRQDLFNAESFLGKIKNVGRRVHRRKAPQRICQRRRLHLLARWAKRRQD